MQSSQDLNSNLLKSLNSVHLPPPPSSHAQQQPFPKPRSSSVSYRSGRRHSDQSLELSEEQTPTAHREQLGSPPQSIQTPVQRYQVSTPVHMSLPTSSPPAAMKFSHPASGQFGTFSDDSQVLYESRTLGPEISVVPGQLVQKRAVSLKRRTNTSEELALPLTTPPHTVSRSDGPRDSKKTKIQETPTLTQGRSKNSLKNPLSPQYSSPQADADSSVSNEVSKPPQPSFTAPKPSKKQLREQQREQKKLKFQEEETFVLPHPSKMPKIVYESDLKPPYSYATLIGMAILRGDGRKLTLSQIYNWISSTFRYYRKNDVGWQNSIRHNLSLNKAFLKAEKSSDGKGHYWEVAKGHEMQFVKGKAGKKIFGAVLDNAKKSSSDSEGSSDQTESVPEEPFENREIVKRVELDAGDMTSEDEFSDDDMEDSTTKTPKSQIRGALESDVKERPSLKKSHTAIGLQRFTLPKVTYNVSDDEEHDEEAHRIPKKKQQLRSVSTGTGSLRNIPSLEAPETNWAASALGERIIFGQVKPSESPVSRTSNFHLTSSFSCNTNLEISPLKRQETGPLLEPLTPSSRIPSFTTTTTLSSLTLSSAQQSSQQFLSASSFSSQLQHSKTPLRSSSNSHQNVMNGLTGSASASHFHNFLKTPTAKIRTPNAQSNSIMRKFWNSPAFVDDFYTSPSIPRHSDGSGMFGSPERGERRLFMESTNAYGFSDLFGVDICSVVKRAVESANEKGKDEYGSSTDEDTEESNAV